MSAKEGSRTVSLVGSSGNKVDTKVAGNCLLRFGATRGNTFLLVVAGKVGRYRVLGVVPGASGEGDCERE